MASYDPLLGTRTVIHRDWLSRFLTFFHFDIFVHGVHHRHPRLAHTELETTMLEYAEHDPAVGVRVFPYYPLAALDMIPWMLTNPGTGMNAGAPPPSFKDCAEVQTFLADVTAEVLEQPEDRGGVRPTVREARRLTERDHAALGSSTLRYFEHYAEFCTPRTELFFVKVGSGAGHQDDQVQRLSHAAQPGPPLAEPVDGSDGPRDDLHGGRQPAGL
jgi:hypothetical protein